MTQKKKTLDEIIKGLYQEGSLDGVNGLCLPDKPSARAKQQILELIKSIVPEKKEPNHTTHYADERVCTRCTHNNVIDEMNKRIEEL